MNYWKFETSKVIFSIVERTSRGVDAYFGKNLLTQYRSPVVAAEEISAGNHPELVCSPDDGKTLGVPSAVREWTFVRA